MASRLGLEVVTFENTGTVAAPTYGTAGMAVIMDETVNMEMGLADVTTRAAAGWRLQRGTLIEGSVDITLLYDPENADFTKFKDAFFNRTQLLLLVLDGDPNTGAGGDTFQGLNSAMNVTNFSQPRPLEEAVTVDSTCTLDMEAGVADPADAAPRWEEIVAGP